MSEERENIESRSRFHPWPNAIDPNEHQPLFAYAVENRGDVAYVLRSGDNAVWRFSQDLKRVGIGLSEEVRARVKVLSQTDIKMPNGYGKPAETTIPTLEKGARALTGKETSQFLGEKEEEKN